MCDTVVALPQVTRDGSLILSKNSDREPDEAQALVHIPHMLHSEGVVQCTYITVPQVTETYECILSKPFQMYGAEMGANEYGVVIGNEAVFTKLKFQKHNNGLTGMDLLRLALERSKNAKEAIDCITSLLQLYGQNANGGYRNKNFYYSNSFLIADTESAWVLETAGRHWVTERVKDVRSISNRLSISKYAEEFSSEAKEFAKEKGWWDGNSEFSFQKSYSDWLYTRLGRAAQRESCTTGLSMKEKGKLDVRDCIRILQTHNLEDTEFKPSKANTGSLCMHATGLLNPSQTTGSMVAKIRQGGIHTIWMTGTSNPCLSIYVPFFFGTSTLKNVKEPSAQKDESLWWRVEKIHRWISTDYQKRKALIEPERVALQKQIMDEEEELMKQPISIASLNSFSTRCLSLVNQTLSGWNTFIK